MYEVCIKKQGQNETIKALFTAYEEIFFILH